MDSYGMHVTYSINTTCGVLKGCIVQHPQCHNRDWKSILFSIEVMKLAVPHNVTDSMVSDDRSITLTSTSPGFIQKYFESSRLHHLSTWKAELCEYVISQMSTTVQHQLHGRKLEPSTAESTYRTLMHIDMDCFFASVSIRDKPHLQSKPVAVAHSTRGVALDYSSSEIASCNYIARSKGVKNGSFIGSAKSLAPDLVVVPYEFVKYDEVSRLLYDILIRYADFVQAVSCDEAFVDVTRYMQTRAKEITDTTGVRMSDAQHEQLSLELGERIRREIKEATGCVASVGIASNILLARLATKKAKPDGIRFFSAGDTALLRDVPIRDLPGIGWSTERKCSELGLTTCGDLAATAIAVLQQRFGAKTGTMLHNFSQGRDDRVLENKPRQSVSCEINWGIRFQHQAQIDGFLRELAAEVVSRLHKSGHQRASHVSVTALKKLYEGEPGKFLGCGHCEAFSKSVAPGRAVDSAEALSRHVLTLYREMGLSPTDVRGIGIHLKNLHRVGVSSGFFASGGGNSMVDLNEAATRFVPRGAGHERSDCDDGDEDDDDADDIYGETEGHTNSRNNSVGGGLKKGKKQQSTLPFRPHEPEADTAATVIETEEQRLRHTANTDRKVDSISAIGGQSASGETSAVAPPAGSLKSYFKPVSSPAKKPSEISSSKRPAATTAGGTGIQAFFGAPSKKQKANSLVVQPKQEAESIQVAPQNLQFLGEDVDMEVLESLPPDIREELLAEMRRAK